MHTNFFIQLKIYANNINNESKHICEFLAFETLIIHLIWDIIIFQFNLNNSQLNHKNIVELLYFLCT